MLQKGLRWPVPERRGSPVVSSVVLPWCFFLPIEMGWEEERSLCTASAAQQLDGCMINNLTKC